MNLLNTYFNLILKSNQSKYEIVDKQLKYLLHTHDIKYTKDNDDNYVIDDNKLLFIASTSLLDVHIIVQNDIWDIIGIEKVFRFLKFNLSDNLLEKFIYELI